jgi:hypothetical protein
MGFNPGVGIRMDIQGIAIRKNIHNTNHAHQKKERTDFGKHVKPPYGF